MHFQSSLKLVYNVRNNEHLLDKDRSVVYCLLHFTHGSLLMRHIFVSIIN